MEMHAAFQELHRSNYWINWMLIVEVTDNVLIHVGVNDILNSNPKISRSLLNVKDMVN